MDFVLKNCRLIPELSDNVSFRFANVYVKDGKIQKIESSEHEISSSENVIDCNKMTLLPGLFDLHMHLHAEGSFDSPCKDDFEIMLRASRNAQKYLEYGITTVRDVGSSNRVALTVKQAIDQDILIGPRILASGKIIKPVEYDSVQKESSYIKGISGVEEMVKVARIEFGEGADFIKIYASGSALQASGIPTQPIFLKEEIRAAVQVAEMKNSYVAAHCHSVEAINMCLDEGVYTIEHGTYVDEAAIEKLMKEKSYLVPTLTPLHYRKSSERDPIHDAILKEKLAVLKEVSATRIQNAYEAGLLLGFGTDVSINTFHLRTGMEFRMRKELCGMNNIDILLQATKNSAFIAGLENVTGEIKQGLQADLILVDGNPDEKIDVMYEKPRMVFKGGVKVSS